MNPSSWIRDAFQTLHFDRVPDRLQLRAVFKTLPIPTSIPLVLLFGSAARGEAPNDIDVVVVTEQESKPFHKYERLQINGISVDVNVVDAEWLSRAPKDLEQSYWLSESYAVFAKSEDWLERWMQAANTYWTIEAVNRRRGQFRHLIDSYAEASRNAFRLGLDTVSRLAAHEAARAYVCDLMDQDGAATYSHRLVAECLQQGLLDTAPQRIRGHLEASLFRGASSTARYLTLRKALSGFRRAAATIDIVGHRSLHSHSFAATALSQLLPIHGSEIEALLFQSELKDLLPNEFPSQLTDAPAYTHRRVIARRPMIQDLSIPVRGNVAGARWVEQNEDRLKVIVNTGGCKTPTCSFCSLPQFARRLYRTDPAKAVRTALALHSVSELSLYNDGNFLNEREISVQDRERLCFALREKRIRRLTIESAPRFVTERKLREIQDWSGVSELIVAMGLQTTGSCTAARLLGRPDIDAIFNFAIDEVHAAGAVVRLYVLHGYGYDLAFWDERLVESVKWAAARGVARVSICPYVDPGGAPLDQAHMAHLESTLHTLPAGEDMTLELVGRGLASCGTGAHSGN